MLLLRDAIPLIRATVLWANIVGERSTRHILLTQNDANGFPLFSDYLARPNFKFNH